MLSREDMEKLGPLLDCLICTIKNVVDDSPAVEASIKMINKAGFEISIEHTIDLAYNKIKSEADSEVKNKIATKDKVITKKALLKKFSLKDKNFLLIRGIKLD